MVIAAFSERFPLDAHSYFMQARALPIFRNARTSVVFFFWSGICSAFLLCLLPEVGEVDYSNHGKGNAVLPLVRFRIVFCYVFSPLDPLFPWIRILSSTSRGNFREGISGFVAELW